MFKERYRVRQLEYCNKQMFGDLIITCPTYFNRTMPKKLIQPVPITVQPVVNSEEMTRIRMMEAEKRRTSLLVDQLLADIHNSIQHSTDYNSTTSGRSSQKYSNAQSHDLFRRDKEDLEDLVDLLKSQIERVGIKLVKRLKRRESLRRQQEFHCDIITRQLLKILPNSSEDMCFTVNPQSGESGFSQWVAAMKMVAQLPGGIPPEFRRRLWLIMAEKHLASKGVDWDRVERTCFSEWAHPDDGELGVQIVKDLHRTGCSLFCGEGGQENQALLKKVLLAYARWNKAVGYCQGFNMLAALILQVTDKSESDALKLMIYLIEGVLPDSYFADSLRGLSVDMAVFRELLRKRLPKLSKHLDFLQNMAKEGTTSYEPPLTNVFTMQWFLTLFCNCLPQPSVLRVWDLILLEGNEILLRTALAIWQALADRILRVRTADEFYGIMGILMNELLENNLMDANTLIKAVVTIGPLTELKSLREHYLYNINPWGSIPTPLEISEKQLKVYPKERLALDISALKKQYLKLRQRQRQAHIIFTTAISRQPQQKTPVAMNHLLIGKSALVPTKRIGPPKGSIPPARIPTTLHWKDTTKEPSSSSSSDTELCDDNEQLSDSSTDASPKSPKRELIEDNPIKSDLMSNNDNIVKETNSIVEDIDVPNVSEPRLDMMDNLNVEKLMEIDSEDDSVEFERFLEDRLKCLEQNDSPTEEEKRVNLSRRNSEKALQIIQENSLILHRILQCQSRLSLSPPLIESAGDIDIDDDIISSRKFIEDETCSPTSSSNTKAIFTLNSSTSDKDSIVENRPTSISMSSFQNIECDEAFSSKYSAILEKSKNLNDKYNDLIGHPTTIDSSNKKDIELGSCSTQELIDFVGIQPETPSTPISTNDDFIQFEINSTQETSSNSEQNLITIDEDPKEFLSKVSLTLSNFKNNPARFENSESAYENKEIDSQECQVKVDEDSTPSLPELSNHTPDEKEGDEFLAVSNYHFEFNKRSLSASNSVEKTSNDDDKRSLSATNSIEMPTSPLKTRIEKLIEINEDFCNKLRKTMKQPERNTSSHDWDDLESSNIEEAHSKSSSLIDDKDDERSLTISPSTSVESNTSLRTISPASSKDIKSKNDFSKTKFSVKRGDSPMSDMSSEKNYTFSIEKYRSPSNESKYEDATSPKSNKIFNPFPVHLSTRQNKEIGVKLGLYKK